MHELENFVDTNEDTLMREVQGKLYSYNHQQSIINTCTGLTFQLSEICSFKCFHLLPKGI